MSLVSIRSEASKQRYLKGATSLTFEGVPLRAYLEHNRLHWVVRLKDLLESLDWRLLRPPTWPVGRGSYPPDMIVRLDLYAALAKADRSLRSLETLARTDLGALFICDGLKPSYRTIGNVLNDASEKLSEEFFCSVTRTLLGKLDLGRTLTALDGTVVESAASRHGLVTSETSAQLVARLRRQLIVDSDNSARAHQLQRAELTQSVIAEREKKARAQQR